MADIIKNALFGLAAVVLIALLTWLTGGGDKISSWLHRPRIDAESTSRGSVSTFLAGEEIRFSLMGVSPDKVLWDFEETVVQPGSVQIEHEFPYDPAKPSGIESTRRVDVFYREGEQYLTSTIHVEVSNSQFVSAKVEGKGISLEVNKPGNSDWVLSHVSLGKFENGTYKTQENVPAKTGDPSSSAVVSQDLLKKLGVTFDPAFDPEKSKGVNAYFEFVSPDGKNRLKTVKEIDPQVRQLFTGVSPSALGGAVPPA